MRTPHCLLFSRVSPEVKRYQFDLCKAPRGAIPESYDIFMDKPKYLPRNSEAPLKKLFCTNLKIDTDKAMCSDIDISQSESEAKVHIRLGRDLMLARSSPGHSNGSCEMFSHTGARPGLRPGAYTERESRLRGTLQGTLERTGQADGEGSRPWSSFVPVTG